MTWKKKMARVVKWRTNGKRAKTLQFFLIIFIFPDIFGPSRQVNTGNPEMQIVNPTVTKKEEQFFIKEVVSSYNQKSNIMTWPSASAAADCRVSPHKQQAEITTLIQQIIVQNACWVMSVPQLYALPFSVLI